MRPYLAALDRLTPALAAAEAAHRYADAIDRVAPLVAAVEALGPEARLAVDLVNAKFALTRLPPLSAAELADLDRLVAAEHRAIAEG